MVDFDVSRSVLQPVKFSLLPGVQLLVKRDDLIHPVVSGNKWRKLKYHIEHFRSLDQKESIITYGGAYSNHLVAVACAGAVLSIPVTGIIRGDELSPESNHVLQLCDMYGMKMQFVSREEYRAKAERVEDCEGSSYCIPEGGAGILGARGCSEIIEETKDMLDYLFTGVGSGTTLAGLALGAENSTLKVEGVAAIKNGGYLEDLIREQYQTGNFNLHTSFHGGGFARLPEEMLSVGRQFIRETGILLDPVYTIKVLYAITDLYNKGYFEPGSRVGLLHTGGLTGWRTE